MSKNEYYCQCEMKKKVENGYKVEIGWIPEKYAIKYKYIKLKLDDKWDDGWQITNVWQKEKASRVEASERDYKKQRKVSDV